MTRELYDHQRRGLDRLPADGGYLAFEQGLGKSLTAIEYSRKHDYERVLIVCPAVATGVWTSELSLAYGGSTPSGRDQEAGFQVAELSGTRKAKAEGINHFTGTHIILNYEALLEPAVERAVNKWDPSLVIIDEAQKIKTSSAKRSRVLHRLTKNRPALLLSGTPITKNLLDLYSQYKAVDPAIWDNESWTKFKQRYAIMGGYGGYEIIGYRDTEDLKARIAPHTVVARKEDTLDLPEKTHTIVPVTMGGADWRAYSDMARTGVAEEWVTANPLEKALRLSQIAGRTKLDSTIAFVQDLVSTDESVVVYYRFRSEGRVLAQALGVTDLNGDTRLDTRTELVRDFQNGIGKIFLSQITAGSTAITLTRASNMVYHSLSYAYEDWAQSQDRIHRIGQHDPCNYYYMTARGPKGGITIDDLVLNTLNRKEDLAGTITRDPALLLPKE